MNFFSLHKSAYSGRPKKQYEKMSNFMTKPLLTIGAVDYNKDLAATYKSKSNEKKKKG